MAIATSTALLGAAAIGAGSSLAASRQGSKAAKSAARTEAEAQAAAIDLQREIYNQNREDAAPYRAVGVPALNRLAASYGIVQVPKAAAAPAGDRQPGVARVSPVTAPPGSTEAILQALGFSKAKNRQGMTLTAADLARNFQPASLQTFMGLDEAGRRDWLARSGFTPFEDPADATEMVDVATQGGPDPLEASQADVARIAAGFKASPGYKFRLEEGQNALLNAARARGMSLSGSALKESQRFGEGLAADEFNTFLNRGLAAFGDYRSGLAGVAGVGQAANTAGMVAGQNFGNTTAQLLAQGGANQAGARLAGGAIQAGATSNIGNAFVNAGSNYMLMEALRQPRVTGTTGFAGVGGSPY